MARILVVEDDPAQLEVRRLLLETQGHQVWTAGSRAAASRVFAECGAERVIMDLRLPKPEDGRMLIRELRGRSSSGRSIVLSGLALEFSALPEAALIDQFLPKPFRSEKLLDAVSQAAMSLRS